MPWVKQLQNTELEYKFPCEVTGRFLQHWSMQGGENGFVKNAFITSKASSSIENYHSQMNYER
jgi:hypothetical protein